MSAKDAKVWQNEKVAKLLEAMLQGAISEVKPQLNPQSELGFSFPAVSQLLNITDKEIVSMLESLADEGILERKFFDKFLRCPQCQSLNLRPSYHCPKCGSGNIIRGRILEHLLCKYVGTEDEFLIKGKLVCSKCQQELRALDSDYRSLGLLYKCRDCTEVFSQPATKWRCLKCSSLTTADKILEVNAYSYFLNEGKKNWLGFELKPKLQLIQFFQEEGYEVKENATMRGKSGAEYTFDILATKEEGVVTHRIAVGVEIATKQVGLDKVLDFDDKAYDCGIHHKILVVIPALKNEAESFVSQQRIKVLETRDIDTILAGSRHRPTIMPSRELFQFKSRSHLVSHLQNLGYEIKPYAKRKGKSGAEHEIDILATRDDGIVVHNIVIAIEVADKPIGIEKVFDFDDKAYDCGIFDKILIAVPGLTPEASRFAQRQRIRVFEAAALEPAE